MVFSAWSRADEFLNYILKKKWKAPLLGLAKKVSNILLSVMDWFHYLISEKNHIDCKDEAQIALKLKFWLFEELTRAN